MLKRIEIVLESFIFNSRWALAPFFLGLIVGIGILLVKFGQELWHILSTLIATGEGAVIASVLTLVDMTLVASLLLMIIFSGYEIFVSKIDLEGHTDRPDWMGKVDFTGLKLRVIGAIVAISAIELLKGFIGISDEGFDEKQLRWKLYIHLTFVVSGVLFAVMDRLTVDKEIKNTSKKK